MSIRTIVFGLILSAGLSGNLCASQTPTSPEQQFQYAQQSATNSKEEVRYWLEQSAKQGYLPAQKQLARDFESGLTGPASSSLAIYWLTSIALNDPQDHGYLLASYLEKNQKDISINELIEAWYQLSSIHNPQAEAAYNQLLEQRFDQLRAKQVSEIEELDKKSVVQHELLPRSDEEPYISQLKPLMAFGIMSLIAGVGWIGYRRQRDTQLVRSAREATQTQQLDMKIKELEFTNKQLKRQLEKVFREFKKTKSQSDNHKFELACAIFGYTPQTLPESKAIKLRYRQLSKLYHPDSRGSEEEMKRLNQAFRLITQNVTNS
ncbi:COG0790 FOG TPR repeat [Vibrio sp. B1FLJ16]|uniref:J domain-containing protein n=1 Tax=Vibrio sp. B1FLJ16 TaxID=2751178 RepID=UPI0015F54B6A|nr:J domain-containing protein [Vibrio sp. B1FLJ16]CAD7804356.1 COG0790 FOG TPR repeat [Vibrio sp. B1FLJ16]CAE6897159.1 COG0790 FOG TPR repeat [Vibrio sp. B1FLJ16]